VRPEDLRMRDAPGAHTRLSAHAENPMRMNVRRRPVLELVFGARSNPSRSAATSSPTMTSAG
jgi:hypothetical protein